jgi:CRP-like cAMP-binding protein
MAVEVLETALPANFAARLMPMIDGARTVPTGSERERLEQLRAIATGQRYFRHCGWLRACAFDAARRLEAPWLEEDLATAVASTEPHPDVIALAASVTRPERSHMLSTIELVLLLKGVDLFDELPDRVLAQVAARLDQVDLATDEVVVVQGDSGDCLYVVAQGSVRIQTGDRWVDDLAEGGVFGEMALLDPAPRSATVVAREPTRLARLDRESFLELVNEQPTVGIGVIRVLTARLRARLADIARLDAELLLRSPPGQS